MTNVAQDPRFQTKIVRMVPRQALARVHATMTVLAVGRGQNVHQNVSQAKNCDNSMVMIVFATEPASLNVSVKGTALDPLVFAVETAIGFVKTQGFVVMLNRVVPNMTTVLASGFVAQKRWR